ncbi:hypothetical protein [Nonomuraea jabiensis]|uniref:hypothetical protein n=1 Tax=Nonomuraea jabiensis TaxID=882448 RepID=UPI003D7479F5
MAGRAGDGGDRTLTISFLGYVFPALGQVSVPAQGGLIVVILLLAAVLAVLRFRLTQNVVNVVFLAYGLAILLMFAAGIAHLAQGHPAATDPWDFAAWSPSAEHGLNFASWSFFGLAVLALLGVEVPLNMGVEIRQERAVTRYLLWGSLAVMVAYLVATWGVMVSVPAGEAADITAVARAVGIGLGDWAGKLVALVLAAMFFIITVVYDYSFARLIFVSGLDRRLPKAVSHVNAQKVPDVAVWIQTVLAGVFTVVAFVVAPFAATNTATNAATGPADAQTEVYSVLQAAVTVIWCLSIVVLFVDVLIILRRYRDQFEARRLASPAVFWVASVVGALASLVGVVATLSGSWTPLISNDAGKVTVFGAEIAYGMWFWLVGGIALASLLVGALLYLAGRRASA